MTKAELIKALESLDDDATILVEVDDTIYEYHELLHIDSVKDIVTGKNIENEATLHCFQ